MVELVIQDLEFYPVMRGCLNNYSGYVLQPQIQIPTDATSINISNTGIVSVTALK
ncbi:MAG: hypothetical protein CM15mP85_05220 [Rhodobacterales bacterium]|nr:MAG: hypothetical protein CM15mP85_05220 [Rhodobacterales bacterium]